jgi:mxaK protein
MQSNRINAAIASAHAAELDADVPEARFARASALAQSGKSEAALKLYRSLIQGTRPDMRRAALYNTGNLYMRDSMRYGTDESFKSVPLIELAKQAYRDLLRDEPDDWDARYNLERALWLAPEIEQDASDESDAQSKEQRVMSTLRGEAIDLP